MKIKPKNKNTFFMIRPIFVISSILLVCFPLFTSAQDEWVVPLHQGAKISPLLFDEDARKEGEALYARHCRSCHGDIGKNNPATLTPNPGDPIEEKFKIKSDGALFYKITTGRGLMPQFATVLNDTERWQIIGYIRSYHEGYTQPDITLALAGDAKMLFLSLTHKDKNAIEVFAFSFNDNDTVPERNVELALSVKRYFGFMPLGETVVTADNGKAIFIIDENLRADTAGFVVINVRATDSDAYIGAQVSETFEIGIKNTLPALNSERAIWNTGAKAPLWVIFSYTIAVLLVWSIIAYIIMQLVKLKRSSKNPQNS